MSVQNKKWFLQLCDLLLPVWGWS